NHRRSSCFSLTNFKVSAATMLFRVILPAVLVTLVLMGTVRSHPACPPSCSQAKHYHRQFIRHVSDLYDSSIAPWSLQPLPNSEDGDELNNIQMAVCETCTVKDMIAKPIYIEISVFKRVRNGTQHDYCQCPYELAVGCTCVQKH
ncbi:hypothetical protein ILYODFUR_027857, partial [Ilyodon furcidens]